MRGLESQPEKQWHFTCLQSCRWECNPLGQPLAPLSPSQSSPIPQAVMWQAGIPLARGDLSRRADVAALLWGWQKAGGETSVVNASSADLQQT